MSPKRTLGTAALLALLLAGCPELETPVAGVSGRIVGARDGAYAYPFSRPDQKVALTLPDGAFRIEAVPTSVTGLVLFDGADRAELVPVSLEGGESTRIADRFGADAALAPAEEGRRMPLAATVVAVAVPDGGVSAAGAFYDAVGTDQEDVEQGELEEAVELGPLPAGRFEVRAALPGFVGARASVELAAGATTLLSLPLGIDADAEAPGCGAGLACENGLRCDPEGGRCYACREAADCQLGEVCSAATGLCMPGSGTPASEVCQACTGDAGCVSGVCVIDTGAAEGYCSRGCAAPADCPAGFACVSDRCVAPDGCADWLQTMGSTCATDTDCSDLAGGWCEHAADAPGACTAACVVDADCRIGHDAASTFVCRAGGRLGSFCSL